MHDVVELTKALIARESVTPNDAGCQQLMMDILQPLGFDCETMVFHDTTNLWARKGKHRPLFCCAGHTDVVPSGPGLGASWAQEPILIDCWLFFDGFWKIFG